MSVVPSSFLDPRPDIAFVPCTNTPPAVCTYNDAIAKGELDTELTYDWVSFTPNVA
jgi:hypothetical protein